MREVTIYTDGSCSGNPGPGGWAAVLICEGKHKELSAGFKRTTNNRMELLAVICALEALKERCDVTVTSDSKYVVDAMTKGWVEKWRKKNWTKKDGLKNPDLWERLYGVTQTQDVTWEWVKGHAGNRWNERCDVLAVAAGQGDDLPADTGYLGE